MTNIAWPEGLVNQDAAIANRNFYFTQRIARVVGFDDFARRDIVFLDPFTVRWNPVGVEHNLFRVTQATRQLKILAANADLIGLNFFIALPQCQLKSGDVNGDVDVAVAGLESRLLDVAAGEFV